MNNDDHKGRFPVITDHLAVNIITTPDRFEELKGEWNILYNTANSACVFQSYVWTHVWWKYYGKDYNLAIIAVREKERLVAIAPLMWKNRLGVPHIEPIGAPNQYAYFGFLQNEIYRDDVPEIIASCVAESFPKGIIHIPYYAAGNASLDVFFASLDVMGWRKYSWLRNISHYVYEKKGYDNLMSVKSRKARYNIKYERNKLEKAGALKVSHYADLTFNEEVIERIANIQKRSWLFRRGQEPINSTFYKELIPSLAVNGMAESFILSLDGGDIAFVMNLCTNSSSKYCEYIGFDEKYQQLSPGKVLVSTCIESMLNNGVTIYDFLFGDGDYKRFWGNRTKRVLRITSYKGLRGWVLSWYPHRLHGMLVKHERLRDVVGKFRRIKRKTHLTTAGSNDSRNT
jgi:CelD/BcsL family acetyltransferase involved in cellulose biosynthesis